MDLSGRVTANKGGATVAHTFGVLSLFVAEIIEKVSLGVYTAARLSKDPDRENGHRTLTHTLPFTVLVGWGTTFLCTKLGTWAVIPILFFMMGLALRGIFHEWAKRAGWMIVTLVSAGGAYYTLLTLPPDRGYPMLGLAVGVGCLVHLLGDIITSAGIPLLWPIPTGKRMWRMVGVPDAIAVRVGGVVETFVLRGLFTLVSLTAGIAMIGPAALRKFNIDL